jgi:hypothetical protein
VLFLVLLATCPIARAEPPPDLAAIDARLSRLEAMVQQLVEAKTEPAPAAPSIRPAANAEVIGPSKLEAGVPGAFTMKGVPAEYLADFDWQVFNRPEDAMVVDLMDRAGNPVIFFWSRTPAKCAIIADVNIPGQYQLKIHEFQVGEPAPPPPPPPPPPAKKVTALLLYESDHVDDQYPWLANVIGSQKLRRLQSAKFDLDFADADQKDEKRQPSADVAKWRKYAEDNGLPLPRWFLRNERDELIHEAAVPKEVDASVKLLRDHLPAGTLPTTTVQPKKEIIGTRKPMPSPVAVRPTAQVWQAAPARPCPLGGCGTGPLRRLFGRRW